MGGGKERAREEGGGRDGKDGRVSVPSFVLRFVHLCALHKERVVPDRGPAQPHDAARPSCEPHQAFLPHDARRACRTVLGSNAATEWRRAPADGPPRLQRDATTAPLARGSRVDRVADDSSDWFERAMVRTGESSKYMMREGKLSKRVWDSLGLSPSEAARAVVGRTASERTRAMAKVQSPAAEWSSWAGGRDRIVSSVGASRSLEDGERVAGESACCCACEGGEPRQTEGTRRLEGRRLCPDSAASPSSERSPLSSLFLSPLAFLVSTSSLRALWVVMNTSIAWLS